MPKTTPTPAAVFTEATLHKAAQNPEVGWTGPSGEESSGESVARHLEATAALLDKDGWSRVYTPYFRDGDQTSGTSPADDESLTVKQMVRALLRFIHDDTDVDLRRTLSCALWHVGGDTGPGDSDTALVADRVLDRLVQTHTGTASAYASAWSQRQHRTYADITALLGAGARFARTYGPSAATARAA
ncbi:hypothetical protein ACFY72_34485 [Streptomyces globisporus]|uniref:DUF6197 family protein n=1 Tax=Streptomyces globisporus TaxID=1908 RepID=UPI003684BED3